MKNPGYMVKTKSGKIGVWLHSDKEDDAGRVLVTLDNGEKVRTLKSNLTFIGFQD